LFGVKINPNAELPCPVKSRQLITHDKPFKPELQSGFTNKGAFGNDHFRPFLFSKKALPIHTKIFEFQFIRP
jgi:hypothetical protein